MTQAIVAEKKAVPRAQSPRKRAIRGSLWWACAYPVLKGFQVSSSVVLAWLLSPQAFGVVALGLAAHKGVKMFSEMGIRPALVQNARDDEAFVNTAWTLQVMRGGLIWLVVMALAWPLAWFYQTPILFPIIAVMGLGSVLEGFRSTSYVTLNRLMNERPRALLQISNSAVTRGSMILIALIWPTAWALVIGTLIGGMFFTIVSHALLPGIRNRFRWEPQAAAALIDFGKWIFLGTIIAFFGSELDKLFLGKLITDPTAVMAVIGVYVIARRIANMPREAVQVLGGQMAFPTMAEIVRTDPEHFASRVRKIRGLIMLPAMVLCLIVVFVSPAFFTYCYDHRYIAAAWMAPLMTAAMWISLLNSVVNNALLALGKSKPLAFTGALKVIGAAAGSIVGFYFGGMPGFILGLSFGALIEHVTDLIVLARQGVPLFAQDLVLSTIFLVLAGSGFAMEHFGQSAATPALKVLIVGVGPGLILLAAMIWTAWRVVPVVIKK